MTTGTIMQNSKLPLTIWFLALYFIAQNKDGFTELSLAKYIGVTLKTAWASLYKVRKAIGSRDSMYKLDGNIEMDEAFFGGRKEGKRGRTVRTRLLLQWHSNWMKVFILSSSK